MRYRFMRFPKGKGKAVTLSYDDGSKKDMRLAELFDKYGLKATFNLNGEALRSGWDYCMSTEQVKEYIISKGHEVALHGLDHRAPGTLRPIEGIKEIYECRCELEERYGRIIRGYAYADGGVSGFANGASYDTVRNYLSELDIAYARSLEDESLYYSMPEDWYNWKPTCHQGSDKIDSLIAQFDAIDLSPKGHCSSDVAPRLFYIWGHSSEFGEEKDWQRIEDICRRISGKEDVWYATNMEIYEYTRAYDSLIYSAKGDRVYNPTLTDVWFDIDGVLYEVKSGETLKIS